MNDIYVPIISEENSKLYLENIFDINKWLVMGEY